MSRVDQDAGVESEPHPNQVPDPSAGAFLRLNDSVGPVPIRAGCEAEPVILDWFGPDRADLLVVIGGPSWGGSAWIFRRIEPIPQAPLLFDDGQTVPGLEGLRALCPLPNGRESRFDLVALSSAGLVHVPNVGSHDHPRFDRRVPLELPPDLGLSDCRVSQMSAQDWDGDGRVDLVVGVDDLTDYWPDTAAGVPQEQQRGFNQQAGHPGYDRHGRWRGQPPRGRLFWLRNQGDPGQPRFEPPREITSDTGRVEVALRPAPLTLAWGGGSAVELILTDASGTVRRHRNFGGQRPPVLLDPRPILCSGQPLTLPDERTTVVAADIDGDHKTELIYGTQDGRVFAIHPGKGRDEAREPVPLQTASRILSLGGHAVVSAVDLDADGDLDLIVGDGPGRLFFVEDLGDHTYAAPAELDFSGLPFQLDPGLDGRLDGPAARKLGFACPTIADWDGNGRLDLIVGGAGGEVLFFHHNGSLAQPRWEWPRALRCDGNPLITPPRVRPAVCHWTEGDLPDLLALNLQGFLCVYPRTGPLEVGPPRPLFDRLGRLLRLDGGFGEAGRCTLWAGPWTHPDRLDLLVGLSQGARHIIPALTGRPLAVVDDLPTVLLFENAGRDTLIPRPVYQADGRPLIVGTHGCSPCGVPWSDVSGSLDLLVGSDDGRVLVFHRDHLRW